MLTGYLKLYMNVAEYTFKFDFVYNTSLNVQACGTMSWSQSNDSPVLKYGHSDSKSWLN